jgi:hypothetical protein
MGYFLQLQFLNPEKNRKKCGEVGTYSDHWARKGYFFL